MKTPDNAPNPAGTNDIAAIMALLPHRYPFLLVDRVLVVEPKQRIVARKCVTINEPFFQGHFPGYPIMPGVLQVEAIAQAGGILILLDFERPGDTLMLFTGVERARFRRPVTPGDVLEIEAKILNLRSRAVRLEGAIRVEGKVVCEATITCQLVKREGGALPSLSARTTPEPLTDAPVPAESLAVTTDVSVHPSAIVATGAVVPASCEVGPFCTVGPNVVLGEACTLTSHVVLDGHLRAGARNRFAAFATIGVPPQDLKYRGEPTVLELGDDNDIREYVNISRGTSGGGGTTRIGSGCLIMAYVHIGHDSVIGDGCILANAATLAGHVTVEDYAFVGALCPVHQFCRIGRFSYIGGGTTITQDVLPFSLTSAKRETHAYSVNKVGLSRRGFDTVRLRALQHAFRLLLAGRMNTTQAVEQLRSEGAPSEDVEYLLTFIESSERGVLK